ncbi:deoxyribodipyrimidine photo-lyase [Xanthobacter dioxanivorans]|uniref:Deoxyribodipyrimidine photo-lyase n=1 Tax=Xanthobacter dioxanivorans TaxID=2528964 RepID=A0A974SHZ6_9HYPH|nr:deoxyribodipyrimidine photo-lyase [Xanthobacter dioxanivorans]QRG05887.1 deoxyribodipyrimidine photo-lyase [Xanthobacter dioxanivorans]
MSASPSLLWFRDDLRLADNPALTALAEAGAPVAALYVFDEDSPGLRPLGGAAKWWLAQSLRALRAELEQFGIPLILCRGPATRLVPEVAAALGAARVAFNGRSGAQAAKVDHAVAARLAAEDRQVLAFCAHLLHPPGSVRGGAGRMPRTFSAFQRAAMKDRRLTPPLGAPNRLKGMAHPPEGEALDSFGLEPEHPDWAGGLRTAWTVGEKAAQARLSAFIREDLAGYAGGRDLPAADHVSRLSPHLSFGELSPRQVLFAIRHAADAGTVPGSDADKFEAEIYWREFSHHLLAEVPDLARRNIQEAFDPFPWRECPGELKAWQKGRTGYPLIDAGLRQLWQTGWMHNRVRMAVASFLTKHLLIDWREGEAWFWDTLVDADAASNPASWQWVAGSGLDAAPYFRIFNPVTQGEKFDPDGTYVRTFVPELARLPARLIHKPWTADADTLAAAGVRLGITYPRPLVDHAAARERALRALESTRKS